MIINLKTEDLKVGMFIDLSDSWMENPFWKTIFEIKSEEEISKIIKAGIKRVIVDTTRSRIQIEVPQGGKEAESSCEKADTITPQKTKGEPKKRGSIISATTVKGPDASVQWKREDKVNTDTDTDDIKVVDRKRPERHDSGDSSPPVGWRPEKFMPP